MCDKTYNTTNPNRIKINCFFKKKRGFENFVAAKSAVDDATITNPIIIKLDIQAKNKESKPLLSKKSIIWIRYFA